MELLIVGILILVAVYFVMKNKKEQSEDFTIEVKTTTTYREDKDYDKYSSMLKEATQLKKTNLDGAVQKIKDALAIYNQDSKGHFKLAYYLSLNKQGDEAWGLLVDYLNHLDHTDYLMYHMNCYIVYGEMTKLLKREKNWKTYLFYHATEQYELFMAYAMQGRVEELENLYKRLHENDFFNLSKIKDDAIKEEWRRVVIDFIESKKDILFEVANYLPNGKKTYSEIHEKHLDNMAERCISDKKDKYLLKMNMVLSSIEISDIYNEKISPLLVDIL